MRSDPYQKSAKQYDRFVDPLNRGLKTIGLKMFPPSEGMCVLDVGCGTGTQLSYYQKAGCKVFGLDSSPAMLEIARQTLGEHAELHAGNASELPYPEEMFDLVIAALTLHEMPTSLRMEVVGECKRVVKRDGRILLIDHHPGPTRFPKGWLNKVMTTPMELLAGWEHYKNYRDFLSRRGLPALIEAHSLIVDDHRIVSGGNLGLFLVTLA